MAQEVTLWDALVMSIFHITEERIPYRAVYDMGWIIKNPIEMVIAMDATIRLKEIVDVYYGRETGGTPPPHEKAYFEAGDGDPSWLEDDATDGEEDADL